MSALLNRCEAESSGSRDIVKDESAGALQLPQVGDASASLDNTQSRDTEESANHAATERLTSPNFPCEENAYLMTDANDNMASIIMMVMQRPAL